MLPSLCAQKHHPRKKVFLLTLVKMTQDYAQIYHHGKTGSIAFGKNK
jgi:hypothetical protein